MKDLFYGYEFLKCLISPVRSKPQRISFLRLSMLPAHFNLFISAWPVLQHMVINLPYQVCKNKKAVCIKSQDKNFIFVTLYKAVLQYNHKDQAVCSRSCTSAENFSPVLFLS